MQTLLLLIFLLVLAPSNVTGGPISYASCCAVAGVAAVGGSAAILPALGFTSSGIAAGSWAATWMATYGGNVAAGSLFATFQSAGASGAGWGMFTSTISSVSGICAALTAPLP